MGSEFAGMDLETLRTIRRTLKPGSVMHTRIDREIRRRVRGHVDAKEPVSVAVPWDLLISKNPPPRVSRKVHGIQVSATIERARTHVRDQLEAPFPKFVGDVWAFVRFLPPDDRSDVLNFMDALADSLEGPIVVNDRRVRRWVLWGDPEIDRESPRAEIVVGPPARWGEVVQVMERAACGQMSLSSSY